MEIASYFQAIVSAEDVHRGKPDPEVYLLAASRLGAPPDRCIVVEDAAAGLEGVRRAGMFRIGVYRSGPRPVADLVVSSLDDIHAMLSVWGLFDTKSENFRKMSEQHLDVPNAHVYDATNPKAREFFWNNLVGKLFAQGWDAFWLDSAEPEEFWPHMGDGILRNKQIHIGNGAEYTNIFPLMHTLGVQEYWKAATDRKRVFLLTRSAFLGQQRVGATVWSGDVYGSYWGLKHQVAAGLTLRSLDTLTGQPISGDIGRLMTTQSPIRSFRSFTPAGLSTESSARSSAPTGTGRKTKFGLSTKSSQS